MKIGIIADIHANIHALERVLEELDRHSVDLILCAGDLVCYGAAPNEVLSLLRDRGIPSVVGNYDAAVGWNWPAASRKPSTPMTEPLKRAALAWAKEQITKDHVRYLRGLPWMMEHQMNGLRVRVYHAGPDDLEHAFDPTNAEELDALAKRCPADVIILGHTHHAYIYEYGNKLFINPGAVGRSLDGDTRAVCALLDTRSFTAQLLCVEYDVAAMARAIEHSGMPVEIAALLCHGARHLEDIVKS